MAVKNLGQVKAIYVSNTPPTNTDMIWRDTSIIPKKYKEYIASSDSWEILTGENINSDDLNKVPNITNGDNEDTGITITNTPGGAVLVLIDGIKVILGDGVKTEDCYFTNDSGATARAISDIASGDSLYWNGDINSARFKPITFGNLSSNNTIDLIY